MTSPVIHRTEIDGVPTFWSPVEGPITAALLFRVGTSDEVLARSGITHLVEHLAMHELRERRYQMNAFVDHRRTVFHCRGNAEEVTGFLSGITQSLAALPLERAEQERTVLEAESARRQPSLADQLAVYRFGATGLGMAVYREFGLLWLGPDHLRDWASTSFTRGNATLWISSPPPRGITLELPDGPRRAETRLGTTTVPMPAWFNGQDGVVGLSMVGHRSVDLMAATALVDRRLKDRVRHSLALSYTPGTSYLPLSSNEAHIVAAADGSPDNTPAIRDELLGVIDQLASIGPEQREIDDHVREIERAMEEPTAALGLLDVAATCELTGDEWLDPDEHMRRLQSLRPPAIASALSTAHRSTLLSVPAGIPGPESLPRVPEWSPWRVDGRRFKAAPAQGEARPPKRDLLVGPDGVSLAFEQGAITTRFERCVALLRYEDGGRTLIDAEGFHASVLPREWKGASAAIESIERAVPPDLHVPMPGDARTPSAAVHAPKPPLLRPGFRRLGWWTWLVMSVLLSLAMFSPPSVDRSEIQRARGPAAPAGRVDCGPRSSLSVVLGGADPSILEGSALVRRACEEDARWLVIVSLAGLISAGAASVMGVRAVRRNRGGAAPQG